MLAVTTTKVSFGTAVYDPDNVGTIMGSLKMRLPNRYLDYQHFEGELILDDPDNWQQSYRTYSAWYDVHYEKVRITTNGFIVNDFGETYHLSQVDFKFGTPFGMASMKLDYDQLFSLL